MRSGFVAGDQSILKDFLLYRTYHGSAMNSAVQVASEAAWNEESHVCENRQLYREKFSAVTSILSEYINVSIPEATFYLWIKTPINDTDFALQLYQDYNVTVLPGSYLAREAHGRMALVTPLSECIEASKRIKTWCIENQ